MGDFANLLDSNLGSGNNKSKQNKSEGILNLDIGNNKGGNTSKPSLRKGKTAHEAQIDAQQEKLQFANDIDPVVKQWSKEPSTGTEKDISQTGNKIT